MFVVIILIRRVSPVSVLFGFELPLVLAVPFCGLILQKDLVLGWHARLEGEWTLLMETSRSSGWKTQDSRNLLKFLQLVQRIIVQNLVFTVQLKVGILTFTAESINFLLPSVRKRALFPHLSAFLFSFYISCHKNNLSRVIPVLAIQPLHRKELF